MVQDELLNGAEKSIEVFNVDLQLEQVLWTGSPQL